MHEPEQGVFDFGNLNRDMSMFLNLTRFIEIVKEEEMFLIFRPGPFISSGWEFGGFPRYHFTNNFKQL